MNSLLRTAAMLLVLLGAGMTIAPSPASAVGDPCDTPICPPGTLPGPCGVLQVNDCKCLTQLGYCCNDGADFAIFTKQKDSLDEIKAWVNSQGPSPAQASVFLGRSLGSYALELPATGRAVTRVDYTGYMAGAYGWCFSFAGINHAGGDWRTLLRGNGQSLGSVPLCPVQLEP